MHERSLSYATASMLGLENESIRSSESLQKMRTKNGYQEWVITEAEARNILEDSIGSNQQPPTMSNSYWPQLSEIKEEETGYA